MAKQGTFLGEVQRACKRFWGLKWFVKWPIIVFVGLVALGIALPSSDEDADITASADREDPTSMPSDESPSSTPKPERPTNTPKPTETPKPPTNTPTPRPPTPTPPPPGFTFGNGKTLVGTEIVAGATYRTRTASAGCYWARLSGLGGTLGEILANDNTNGPAVVTIGASDVAFESTRCSRWTQDLSAITADPNAPFKGDGTYIVNVDISPGLWKSDGSGSCYWARLSDFSAEGVDGIIANDNATGPTLVQIGPNDIGFTSARCGTWTRQQ